jgi:hypothetical protein
MKTGLLIKDNSRNTLGVFQYITSGYFEVL